MLPTRVCGQSFDAFVGHTRGRRGGLCLRVLCFVAGVLLVGCQTARPPAMSVEEAKRVTIQLSGQSFVPPPRTINDVLAALERESGEREARRPFADAVEPPNVVVGEGRTQALRPVLIPIPEGGCQQRQHFPPELYTVQPGVAVHRWSRTSSPRRGQSERRTPGIGAVGSSVTTSKRGAPAQV